MMSSTRTTNSINAGFSSFAPFPFSLLPHILGDLFMIRFGNRAYVPDPGQRAPVPRHKFQGDNPKSEELRRGNRPWSAFPLSAWVITAPIAQRHLFFRSPLSATASTQTSLLHTRHPARPLGSRPSKLLGKATAEPH